MSVVQSQLRKLKNTSYADKAPSIFLLYILELNALNIFFSVCNLTMEKIKQFLLFVTSRLVKDTLFSIQKSLYKK